MAAEVMDWRSLGQLGRDLRRLHIYFYFGSDGGLNGAHAKQQGHDDARPHDM